ncbi:MAG: helix-turn-helix transcriptional regulator [bacterium]|nr:helix-turn-helix transcriptional regulator [bacterium]
MPIRINLDLMMVRRGISLTELSERVGITMANLSILKNNRARAVRFSTLEALCRELHCQPGELLEFAPGAAATDGQEI